MDFHFVPSIQYLIIQGTTNINQFNVINSMVYWSSTEVTVKEKRLNYYYPIDVCRSQM